MDVLIIVSVIFLSWFFISEGSFEERVEVAMAVLAGLTFLGSGAFAILNIFSIIFGGKEVLEPSQFGATFVLMFLSYCVMRYLEKKEKVS